MSAYLSDKTLATKFEVSRATIWRWVKEGKLPHPVKINGSTRWNEQTVNAWLASSVEVA